MLKDRLIPLRERKAKLEGKKITQQDIADALEIERSSYARYERGTRIPTAEVLSKLADYFNCTTDYLLERTEDPRAVLWTDAPKEMKDAGIDAVELLQEALDKGFTKKDIKKMINMYHEWKKVDEEE